MAGCRGVVKLFGMTIPVPAEVEEAGTGSSGADLRGGDGGGGEGGKQINEHRAADHQPRRQQDEEEVHGSSFSSVSGSSRKEPKAPAAEEQQQQQKNPPPPPPGKTAIKKPDTILPCPRCSSMDTKFCYYNNYNVNQPRHFCKSCQRYWTAGGTMRDVPVGAGRRKNKHSAAGHYRQIAVAEAAVHPAVRPGITEHMNPNGTTVLSFAADWPLCESMGSLFNLAGKTTTHQGRHNDRNGLRTHTINVAEPGAPFSGATAAPESTTEENSGGSSSVTASTNAAGGDGGGASNNDEAAAAAAQNCREGRFSLGGAPWPYPWAVAPAMCASPYPAISFYPVPAAAPSYWGGRTVPAGAWSVPWLAPPSSSPPSSSSAGSAGPPNYPPTLGKRSREEDADAVRRSRADRDGGAPAESKTLRWIPKTLGIEDPEVAAKSSVWATMALRGGKGDVGSRRGLFDGFNRQPSKPETCTMAAPETNSHAMHANPAALSRSLNFREGA